MPSDREIGILADSDWDMLVSRIKRGFCTPFLGAGISSDVLPTGPQIAAQLAADPRFSYPLTDKTDLIKVSQFIALTVDSLRPKELVAEMISKAADPNFDEPDEPHSVLARLPLPLFLTTNYDDFLVKALKNATPTHKNPRVYVNQWYQPESDQSKDVDINPTVESPVVYYFHGSKDDLYSMVLTEDDYLDFLVRISKDQTLIPPRIKQALSSTSLLFIGYSLSDMNFRVIFRGLVESARKTMRRLSITVQIPSDEPLVVKYLTEYFRESGIRVYWGTARQFLGELRTRLEISK
jgi:hypothetical protein